MAHPVSDMAPVSLPGIPSYIKVIATRVHHRDHGFMRKGDEEQVTMRFNDFDDASRFLHLHNEVLAEQDGFHYTGFYVPSACGRWAASFDMFDISDLWDRLGYDGSASRTRRHWEKGAMAFNRRLNNLTRALSAANHRGEAERAKALRAQVDTLAA